MRQVWREKSGSGCNESSLWKRLGQITKGEGSEGLVAEEVGCRYERMTLLQHSEIS